MDKISIPIQSLRYMIHSFQRKHMSWRSDWRSTKYRNTTTGWIELSALSRQYLGNRRIPNLETLQMNSHISIGECQSEEGKLAIHC